MLKKKIIILGTLLLLTSSLTIGCQSNKESNQTNKDAENTLVTLVLDKGTVNDESFNQSAWNGAKKAKEELGVNIKYLESNTDADYATNIEHAIDLNSDLIIGVGFNLTDAIGDAAKNYPEQKFAIVDGSFEEIPSNVTPILFNEKEAGYLAGIVAAKSIEGNNFGFIGGFEVPAVINFKEGFEEGLLYVNKDATLSTQYANSFTDAAKGKIIAKNMYSNDINCIMTAGGGVNIGVYEAASELNKYAVAVDMAQNSVSPNVILTSALKNVDIGVYDVIKNLTSGSLKSGEAIMYNISNDGVGFEKTKLLSDETISFAEAQKEQLKEKSNK